MAKDPAFLFYPGDFLMGTMYMSDAQIGIYVKLLCSQHQHGGIIDKVCFNSLAGENNLIRSKFIECEEGFYNERLAEEMGKRNKKSNNLSDAAKEVWENRKKAKNTIVSKNDTIVLQLHNNSKEKLYNSNTIVIQPENRNENENRDINFDLWTEIKISFFNDFRWFEKFCLDKKISPENLKIKMEDFIKDTELREDFKTLKELKSHFTNLFNKQNGKFIKTEKSRDSNYAAGF
jgi:uncharacterized protein YdaU (DUF1376 family)